MLILFTKTLFKCYTVVDLFTTAKFSTKTIITEFLLSDKTQRAYIPIL